MFIRSFGAVQVLLAGLLANCAQAKVIRGVNLGGWLVAEQWYAILGQVLQQDADVSSGWCLHYSMFLAQAIQTNGTFAPLLEKINAWRHYRTIGREYISGSCVR